MARQHFFGGVDLLQDFPEQQSYFEQTYQNDFEQPHEYQMTQTQPYKPKNLGIIVFTTLQSEYKQRRKVNTYSADALYDLWKVINRSNTGKPKPKKPSREPEGDLMKKQLEHRENLYFFSQADGRDVQFTLRQYAKEEEQDANISKFLEERKSQIRQSELQKPKKRQMSEKVLNRLYPQKQEQFEDPKSQQNQQRNQLVETVIRDYKRKNPESKNFKYPDLLKEYWSKMDNKPEGSPEAFQEYFTESMEIINENFYKFKGFYTDNVNEIIKIWRQIPEKQKSEQEIIKYESEENLKALLSAYIEDKKYNENIATGMRKLQMEQSQKKPKQELDKNKLKEMAKPKDRLKVGKTLLEMRKAHPHDPIIRRMILDEFKDTKVAKYPLEYDVADSDEDNRQKMRHVSQQSKAISLEEMEVNENMRAEEIAELFERHLQEYYSEKQRVIRAEKQKQQLIKKEDAKLKQNIENMARKYLELRKKRLEEKVPTVNEYLSSMYKQLLKSFKEAVQRNFPHSTKGESKKLRQKSFPSSLKRYFFAMMKSYVRRKYDFVKDKTNRLGFWAPTNGKSMCVVHKDSLCPPGCNRQSLNQRVHEQSKLVKESKVSSIRAQTSVWDSESYQSERKNIMMTFSDAKECTFQPAVCFRMPSQYKKIVLDTHNWGEQIVSKKGTIKHFLEQFGENFKKVPTIYRFGMYKRSIIAYRKGDYRKSYQLLAQSFNIHDLKIIFKDPELKLKVEDHSRTYGNTFWASIDPQVAKEIATEFRLYKNKTLLSLLDYSGNGTDSDKINHFSKDIVLQPLMELLVQWQLRTCLTEFKESIHQFRIAVAHTVFYQPMPDIDTNWKYIFYQLIIHTGKQPSRTYEESVSFQKNFQIQDKENAEIKRFLSDLSIYCNLGIHIVVHENKFPSNTMEIYGNQGYKYLHIIVWKNFGHFISLSWEQNKALNNQMRKGGGVFKEIDYQEEFQYLRNKDQDENYQIMQNGIYRFKPCAEIQKLQQVQVRVLKNSWDSDVQEEEENPMIEDFADLMKNYSVKSSTSKKQITQTPPQANSVKKKIKKVIQKKNGINFLQDICFFRQQLNGSPIQFENLSYEDYVIAPKDYEQLLVYKDIICVRSRGKFYMLNQRQAIQFSNQFQGQILNRWTQDILVKGCMLPSPPEGKDTHILTGRVIIPKEHPIFNNQNLGIEEDEAKKQPHEDMQLVDPQYQAKPEYMFLQEVYQFIQQLENYEEQLVQSQQNVKKLLNQDKSRFIKDKSTLSQYNLRKTQVKDQMCPLGESCPALQTRWPNSNITGVTPIGAECLFAHHPYQLRFHQELCAKKNALRGTLKQIAAQLGGNAGRKAWNPAGNTLSICIGCSEKTLCSDCQIKKANIKTLNILSKKAKEAYTKIKSKPQFKQKRRMQQNEENNFKHKVGYLSRANALFNKERYSESFDIILKAVEIVKNEIDEKEKSFEKSQQVLKQQLHLDVDVDISLKQVYESTIKPNPDDKFEAQKLYMFAKQTGMDSDPEPDTNRFINTQIELLYRKIEHALTSTVKDIDMMKQKITKIEDQEDQKQKSKTKSLKNKMCPDFIKTGLCKKGQKDCAYSHNYLILDLAPPDSKIKNLQESIKVKEVSLRESKPPLPWVATGVKDAEKFNDTKAYDKLQEKNKIVRSKSKQTNRNNSKNSKELYDQDFEDIKTPIHERKKNNNY